MAIYDVDAIRESELMEAETDSDSILDNMLEACDQMLYGLAQIDEGARTKYVEMKAKQAKELEDKANAMPDKITSTKSKKIGPYTFSASKEVDNKEKKKTMDQHYEASKTAAKYAGTYEDYGLKGKKEVDPDGKEYTVRERWSSPEGSVNSVHNAGTPRNRYDSGAHRGEYGQSVSKKQDYEAMAKSKAGKDKFMKDFGGPQGDDYMSRKTPGLRRPNSKHDDWTYDDSKFAMEHNKKVLKDHFAKKKAIKETCLTILSVLDEI